MTTENTLEAQLQEATAALAKANEDIAKLKEKNSEIIAVQKKAQAHAEQAREAAEAAEEEKARLSNDVATLEKQLTKKFEKQIADLQTQLSERDTRLTALLIDDGITKAMIESNIAPQYQKAFTALMKADAKLVEGAALIGDEPLGDYIKAYVASDAGKPFVAAPLNSGANAMGAKPGVTGQKPLTRTEYIQLMASDPAAAKAYAEKNAI